MYRQIITAKTVTLYHRKIKNLLCQLRNVVGLFKKAFLHRPIKILHFSQTRENSKMFNKASKYFNFFNNKPPASWVAHITRDFLHVIPIKSILIREYQHKSTRVNTNQHESTRVNTSQHESNTSQQFPRNFRRKIFASESLLNRIIALHPAI